MTPPAGRMAAGAAAAAAAWPAAAAAHEGHAHGGPAGPGLLADLAARWPALALLGLGLGAALWLVLRLRRGGR